MSFVVRILMEKANGSNSLISSKTAHVDGQFMFDNLEKARQAAEVACHAAANLNPCCFKEADDDDWRFHPDRTD